MIRVTMAQAIGSRDEQEDAAHTMAFHDGVIAVLADGMGGHHLGAEAAQAAVDAVLDFVRRRRWPHDSAKAVVLLNGAVDAACRKVRVLGGGSKAPGCTLLVALVRPGQVALVSVGDSRVWWSHALEDEPRRLVQRHGFNNVVLSHIPARTKTDFVLLEHVDDGRLVLASDGIAKPLGDTAVGMVQNQLALNERRQDNATAIVIDIRPGDGVHIGELVMLPVW